MAARLLFRIGLPTVASDLPSEARRCSSTGRIVPRASSRIPMPRTGSVSGREET